MLTLQGCNQPNPDVDCSSKLRTSFSANSNAKITKKKKKKKKEEGELMYIKRYLREMSTKCKVLTVHVNLYLHNSM